MKKSASTGGFPEASAAMVVVIGQTFAAMMSPSCVAIGMDVVNVTSSCCPPGTSAAAGAASGAENQDRGPNPLRPRILTSRHRGDVERARRGP